MPGPSGVLADASPSPASPRAPRASSCPPRAPTSCPQAAALLQRLQQLCVEGEGAQAAQPAPPDCPDPLAAIAAAAPSPGSSPPPSVLAATAAVDEVLYGPRSLAAAASGFAYGHDGGTVAAAGGRSRFHPLASAAAAGGWLGCAAAGVALDGGGEGGKAGGGARCGWPCGEDGGERSSAVAGGVLQLQPAAFAACFGAREAHVPPPHAAAASAAHVAMPRSPAPPPAAPARPPTTARRARLASEAFGPEPYGDSTAAAVPDRANHSEWAAPLKHPEATSFSVAPASVLPPGAPAVPSWAAEQCRSYAFDGAAGATARFRARPAEGSPGGAFVLPHVPQLAAALGPRARLAGEAEAVVQRQRVRIWEAVGRA
jgi:hypothetical protein